ncbi:hypothetical protein ACFQ0B_60670 [Nonomuraea thailandensis]
MLNLFLAVVVSAMDEENAEERAALEDTSAHIMEDTRAHTQQILDELAALRKEVAELRALRETAPQGPPAGMKKARGSGHGPRDRFPGLAPAGPLPGPAGAGRGLVSGSRTPPRAARPPGPRSARAAAGRPA